MAVKLSLAEVHELASRALTGSGAVASVAAVMADSVRDAEADGLRNVGLAYLPVYCRHLRCAKVRGDAVPRVEQSAPAMLRVDAGDGFCHPAFVAAEARFVTLVHETGIAAMVLTRSYSAGVLGWFSERLAHAGLVSLAFANSSPLVAPYGGRRAFFGTNPLALGAPRARGEALVIDLSTSATAYVNVLEAARRGEPIPPGWALDAHGRPTTDPGAAIEGGTMAPLGGYKGTALALMVELLAAGVSGSNWSYETSSFIDDEGGPVGVGQLFIGIDPARAGGGDLGARLERMLAAMCAQEGVRIPGEHRHESRRRTRVQGVALASALHAELLAFCV